MLPWGTPWLIVKGFDVADFYYISMISLISANLTNCQLCQDILISELICHDSECHTLLSNQERFPVALFSNAFNTPVTKLNNAVCVDLPFI